MQLGAFRIRLTTSATPAEAWRALWDLRAHTAMIPFTHLTPELRADELRVGTKFTAWTRMGPLKFADPMVVLHVEPPQGSAAGRMVLAKTGRVILGGVDCTVSRQSGSGRGRTQIVWRHRVGLRGLPPLLNKPAALVAKLAYAIALRRLLRRA